jgi:hypothetical protein
MPEPTRATLGTRDGTPFEVHFNPAALDLTLTNTLESGGSNQTTQYVAQSSAKLGMELVFDTTGTGEDVRIHTERVAKLMEPVAVNGGEGRRAPPVVLFRWGAYSFDGIIESYKEKIDFFSSGGVPLRATVSLTLSRQDRVFDAGEKNPNAGLGGALAADADAVETRLGAGDSVEKIAGRAGDPAAAPALAAANGLESLRVPGASALRVPTGVSLAPPVPFAPGSGSGSTAAASSGLDVDFDAPTASTAPAGLGTGGSKGVASTASVPGSAGTTASATRRTPGTPGTNATAAAPRGNASAGVAATEGAFVGLRQRATSRAPRLDPSRVVQTATPDAYGSGAEVDYAIGGRVMTLGAGSTVADVGQDVRLAERIRFDRGEGGRKR